MPSSPSSSICQYWQVLKSVAAGMFGVQTEQARAADFQKASPVPFIITGVLAVVALIGAVLLIVNIAVAQPQELPVAAASEGDRAPYEARCGATTLGR